MASVAAIESKFVSPGGGAWTVDINAFIKEDAELKPLRKPLRHFYKRQNTMIRNMLANQEYEVLAPGSPHNRHKDEDLGEGGSPAAPPGTSVRNHARLAINLSFYVNILLFLAKAVAVGTSGSMAMLASAVDSLLDLVSGSVLWLTERFISKPDRYTYPEGKSRYEPLGVAMFSCVMGMSALQLKAYSSGL